MKKKRIIRGLQKSYKCLLILMVSTSAFLASGQQSTVSGTVTDATDGISLPGVTVQIKGTQRGVATDIDGKYSINVSPGEILVFTYVGYKPQRIAPGNRTIIDVGLQTDIQELSEIVVVGYGQVEKGDVTGVVNKVDAKDFNSGVLTSPANLIAGKVAGVQVVTNDGAPGSGISIRIRGGTSLTAGNEPLYVVDGVPLDNDGVAGVRNPLNFINPADIADITILKDASSAAIYGSRGANGVVIITTKKGSPGKPKISYDGNYTIGFNGKGVDMLNAEEFEFTVRRKAPRYKDDLGSSNTDWFDEITQVAKGMNHNLGVSFGSQTNSGRVSLNYQDVNGLLKTDNLERISGAVNFTQSALNDDLQIGISTKHSIINNRFAPNVIGSALVFDPTQSVFADDPSTGGYFEWSSVLAPANPVAQIAQTFNIGKTKRNLIGANLNYNLPLEGLSVKLNYAYDNSRGESQVTRLINPSAGIVQGNFSTFEDSRTSGLFEAYLNYNTELTNGRLDLTVGYSYQDFQSEVDRSLFKRDTVSLNTLDIQNPGSFISSAKLDEIRPFLDEPLIFELENRLISFWGRANLSLKDKYLITATLRRDGSTRFGERNRWGLFPSVAVGWRVIDEPFASGLENVMSNLKLRLSYGITGNEEIGDYLYVNLYQQSDDRSAYIFGQDTVNTFRPNSVDPDIKWEETRSLNFGIDYGFLEGRVYGSIDIYRKLTTDLLFDIAFPIGTLTGDRAVTNIGEMENKGIEFLINTIAIDRDDLRLDIGFNAALNKNEILKLDNSNLPDFQGYTTGDISGNVGERIQILKVGYPVNSFFVYEHKMGADGKPIPDGVDVNNDGLRNELDMYVDQNEDGIINDDDLRPYKKPAPDVILGLTGNLTYKNFDLAMTLRGQIGGYTYNNVQSQYGAFQGANNAFSPNNIHTSAYDNDFTDRQLLSDIYVENASFLKLDNVTLGYNINSFEAISAKAFVTATNLLTLTGYSGVDPEAGINGIDNNLYPRSRTILIGLNIKL
ncbi:iron complex outermembrane recepter protein [Ekhidna lutea]|uniref:Iron complex outermembrane recepter protein n=1 Tax=Ekhidna lutea TaxID=447679 RepID=A0A239LX68_EKHLU|nr:TonB-dependent receptor [Ekhidna lutea]SNT34468.1 iron complex outermembrane recepter protein [Ekhidna lutea]